MEIVVEEFIAIYFHQRVIEDRGLHAGGRVDGHRRLPYPCVVFEFYQQIIGSIRRFSIACPLEKEAKINRVAFRDGHTGVAHFDGLRHQAVAQPVVDDHFGIFHVIAVQPVERGYVDGWRIDAHPIIDPHGLVADGVIDFVLPQRIQRNIGCCVIGVI